MRRGEKRREWEKEKGRQSDCRPSEGTVPLCLQIGPSVTTPPLHSRWQLAPAAVNAVALTALTQPPRDMARASPSPPVSFRHGKRALRFSRSYAETAFTQHGVRRASVPRAWFFTSLRSALTVDALAPCDAVSNCEISDSGKNLLLPWLRNCEISRASDFAFVGNRV